MLKTMKLEYVYENSYTVNDENGYIAYERKIDVFSKFISGVSDSYMRYDFDVTRFLSELKENEKLSEKLHYELLNLSTSFTLKGAKKVAMLQGNSRDMMQECDMIEARNNAYASILQAIKEGQFTQLCEDFHNTTNEADCETIINGTKKALASLCYKMLNAYTYQLKRDARHLSVDAMMTDSDGNDVPIIETIASEHIENVERQARIESLLEAMTSKQLKAIHTALNDKQVERYHNILDAMLQSKALTNSDTRFYQRSNNAIQEIYKTL